MKYIVAYVSIHPTGVQRNGDVWSVRRGPGKGSQRKPAVPLAVDVSGRSLEGRKKDKVPSIFLEKPEWHESCSLHLSLAEPWPVQSVGCWVWG